MALQPTLPNFEGRKVSSTKLKVNGIAGNPSRPFKVGDTLYLVTEIVIDAVEHVEKEQLITRLHKARIRQYGELDKERGGELIAGMIQAAREAAEDDAGIIPMFRDSFGNSNSDEPEDDDED